VDGVIRETDAQLPAATAFRRDEVRVQTEHERPLFGGESGDLIHRSFYHGTSGVLDGALSSAEKGDVVNTVRGGSVALDGRRSPR
jgi:hypothetical protein